MRHTLEWTIEKRGDTTVVIMSGSITERAALDQLAAELGRRRKVRFDLSDIQRVNSSGVKEWLALMRALPVTMEVWFESCSPPVVHQINLIKGFTGHAKVGSIDVPMVCDRCGAQETMTIGVTYGAMPALGTRPCRSCGGSLELDDFAETYFAFLGG
jgi:ABC-type transporter Mla MlaB component